MLRVLRKLLLPLLMAIAPAHAVAQSGGRGCGPCNPYTPPGGAWQENGKFALMGKNQTGVLMVLQTSGMPGSSSSGGVIAFMATGTAATGTWIGGNANGNIYENTPNGTSHIWEGSGSTVMSLLPNASNNSSLVLNGQATFNTASGSAAGETVQFGSNTFLVLTSNGSGGEVQFDGTGGTTAGLKISGDGSTGLTFNAPTGQTFTWSFGGTTAWAMSASGTTTVTLSTSVANSGTAIALIHNNTVTLSTTAKLEEWRNNGTVEDYIDNAGVFYSKGLQSFGGSQLVIQTAAADGFLQAAGTNTTLRYTYPVAASQTNIVGQVGVSHISGGGGVPTAPTAGTGCGTSSAATNAGSDVSGTLGVTCGTAGTTTNPYVTITFKNAYSTAPYCTISPMNAATAGGLVSSDEFPVTTTTTLAVSCGGGTCSTGTLLWSYTCHQ